MEFGVDRKVVVGVVKGGVDVVDVIVSVKGGVLRFSVDCEVVLTVIEVGAAEGEVDVVDVIVSAIVRVKELSKRGFWR